MGIKFIDDLIEKIASYLPDDEPVTKEERIYEEGKKRVFEMHAVEPDIFYVEDAWLKRGRGSLYGELAKGRFRAGDMVCLLDVHGNLLREVKVLAYYTNPENEDDMNQEVGKSYLDFEGRDFSGKEDFFVQVYYVIKKH